MTNRNPKDPVTNVLYNQKAMAILEDACARLRALGLHCSLAPDAIFPDSDTSMVLRVSPSAQALHENIVGSLVVSDFAASVGGRKIFDERLAEFNADSATLEAMNNPGANGV